ncbi:MAG: hypothetical protein ACO3GO_00390 [Terrimicrobiaceae bacterium]
MKKFTSHLTIGCVALVLSACAGGSGSSASSTSTNIPPGMNASGEVIDSSQVSEGYGKKVNGRNGWTGEILGVPAAGSKFKNLQIGMPVAEVARILGAPSDQGAYITGQAFNPFHFGSGKSRYEMVYKNQGRLIFDSPSAFDFSGTSMSGIANGAYGNGYLVWIINNSREPGYR